MIPFFEKYLSKQALFPTLIHKAPNKELNKIVCIPAYNEPNLISTLESIKKTHKAKLPSEVIILINHSETTAAHIKKQNEKSFFEVKQWIHKNTINNITYHTILIGNLQEKHAGVGIARKIAMDECIRRFSSISNENGIIISLDADTLVSDNYLVGIEKEFLTNNKTNTILPWFEHQPNQQQTELNEAICKYELYLRYFKQALKYTGFPYAYHTIGSAFAVKALAYAKQGGMNKKQGGEDFYFLQKIFKLGFTKELKHVKVWPSSRISDRVPFGTGPAVQKILDKGEFLTYKFKCFKELKLFFDQIPQYYKANEESLRLAYKEFSKSLQSFLSEGVFIVHVNEINKNSSNPNSFTQRFYQWFDAFKIIKYLNFTHLTDKRIAINDAATEYLNHTNNNTKAINKNSNELLTEFKRIEQKTLK